MSDVFISYSTKDRPLAQKLASFLESEGVCVWWDVELVGGQNFRSAITKQLKEAKAVLVLWSEYSVESRFVLDEADFGASSGKLISVVLEHFNQQELPLGFRMFQYVLYNDVNGIMRSLKHHGIISSPVSITQPPNERQIVELSPEDSAWAYVLTKRDAVVTETFLRHFPSGRYAEEATKRLRLLQSRFMRGSIASLLVMLMVMGLLELAKLVENGFVEFLLVIGTFLISWAVVRALISWPARELNRQDQLDDLLQA